MMDISTFTSIAGRASQEDRLLVEEVQLAVKNGNGIFIAVMDGHCGTEVVKCIHEKLSQAFCESMFFCEGNIQASLLRTVKFLQDACRSDICGSTLSMIYIPVIKGRRGNVKIYTGHIGDSPIFAWNKKGKLFSSALHNVSENSGDVKEIEKRHRDKIKQGELYISRNGINFLARYLQLTRSIGDQYFENILLRTAESNQFEVKSNSPIIVASDGIFVQNNTQEIIVEILDRAAKGNDAEEIGAWILDRAAHDNVTLVIVR